MGKQQWRWDEKRQRLVPVVDWPKSDFDFAAMMEPIRPIKWSTIDDGKWQQAAKVNDAFTVVDVTPPVNETLRRLKADGRVYIAMIEREPSGVMYATGDFTPPRGPTITELTVLYHGSAVDFAERPLKRYVSVSFIYKGQESESVMVREEDVTQQGLLKAADSFLIQVAEDEV